jgi:hypothetical protein
VEHLDYYIKQLGRIAENENIEHHISLFTEFENEIDDIKKYKYQKLDEIVTFIANTEASNHLNNWQVLSAFEYTSKNTIKENLDKTFISLDFKSANYNTYRKFDDKNELPSDWYSFCDKFKLHQALIESKSFRQAIFGNLNPKRIRQYQLLEINDLINLLIADSRLSISDIVYINNDEIIFAISDEDYQKEEVITEILRKNNYFEDERIMTIKKTKYKLKHLGKDKFIKEIFKKHHLYHGKNVIESYKTLFGIPGNEYHRYLKEYILEEPIDDRDLYFINDGKLAKWLL